MANKIIKALWGDLSEKELLKFVLLSIGSFFLIGSYWPLKTLKDSIFINLIGATHLPDAKLASLILFFPLVLLYSKLVDIFSKEKMIYVFISFYVLAGLVLVYYLSDPVIGLQNTSVNTHRYIGWAFYLFVESYGSLMVSLYLSFINDVTTPEAAQKGYGMLSFGTHLGACLFTLLGNFLSYDTTKYAQRVPLIALISISMFVMIAVVVFILKRLVGDKELEGYTAKALIKKEDHKVGFLDGLKVLITRPYVSGIFLLIFFQELLTTIMDLQKNMLIGITYGANPGAVTKFLFGFNLAIQFIACVFGLLGTSYFQRKFGIKACIISFPILLGISLVGYIISPYIRLDLSIGGYIITPALAAVLCVVLIAKVLNYALYQPAKEALYIPTSKNIKYKAKAWIDMFGMRFAKVTGSSLSKFLGPATHLVGGTCLGIIVVWIFLAKHVGDAFNKVTNNKTLID